MSGRPWTDDDVAQLRNLRKQHSARVIAEKMGRTRAAVLLKAAALGLDVPPAVASSTRFGREQKPWNKGLRWRAGGRSAETQFQPGHSLSLTKPLGSTFESAGYLMVKVSDDPDLPGHRFAKPAQWRALHYLVWEKVHGPVPKGMRVAFKNGNKRDFRIENLELVTRREMMLRNSAQMVDDPEYRSLVATRSALTRKVKAILKKLEEA